MERQILAGQIRYMGWGIIPLQTDVTHSNFCHPQSGAFGKSQGESHLKDMVKAELAPV